MENIISLIVKISGVNCNLRCRYCFYSMLDQSKNTIMSYDMLEKVISEFMEMNPHKVHFIWHGGEPLLCGLNYFNNIIDIENKYKKNNQMVKNTLQTNGTLINKEWIKFFKKEKFGVGVSIDGDKISHDRNRVFPNGAGSFDVVINNIRLMQKLKLKFGVIQVLTAENVSRCSEIFNFFVHDLKLERWGINKLYFESNGNMSNDSVKPKEYTEYIKKTIDLWFEHNSSKLAIREIDNLLAQYYGIKPRNCNYNGNCGSYLCVEFDGKVYSCDRFSSNQEFCFGDLSKDKLADVVKSSKRKEFIDEIKKIPKQCFGCRYFTYCNNGCPSYREKNGRYIYCNSRKDLYNYLREIIKTRKEV